jgi:hypothetical protein
MICGCGKEMIMGGSHDYDESDDWLIVNNYSCPDCRTLVLEYIPQDPEEEDE